MPAKAKVTMLMTNFIMDFYDVSFLLLFSMDFMMLVFCCSSADSRM
jgi:hypothetical protein